MDLLTGIYQYPPSGGVSTNGGSTNNSGSSSTLGYTPMYPPHAPTVPQQGWSSGHANLSYLQPYLPPLPTHSPAMTESPVAVTESVHPRKRSRCETEGSDNFNQVVEKECVGPSGENSSCPPKKDEVVGNKGKADGVEEEVEEDEMIYSDDDNTGEGSPL